jgi:hypothetical protein
MKKGWNERKEENIIFIQEKRSRERKKEKKEEIRNEKRME